MIERYENILSENEYQKLSDILKNKANWILEGTSIPFSENKLWYSDLQKFKFITNDLFEKIKLLTGKNFILSRVYANGQTFGMDGEWHQDDNTVKDGEEYNRRNLINKKYPTSTFLYYFTQCEDVSLIGETYFKINNEFHCELPTPNSAIFFDGDIWHKGMGPKKEFKGMRITIAFKVSDSADDINIKTNNTLL